MGIFSNRSIASMLNDIELVLGADRGRDLKRRLARPGGDAVAAEWEIAALWCLRQIGDLESVPSEEGRREIDVIFRSRNTGERVAVEITAVSDASYHEENPVEEFRAELNRRVIRHDIHKHGGIRTDIGDITIGGAVVMGVPARKDLQAFFASPTFKDFFDQIRREPTKPARLDFDARGAKSVLTYEPGARFGGGGNRVFTNIQDPAANPLVSRLKKKDEQIRRSSVHLPAVVIVCDGHCHALSTTFRGWNNVAAEDVVDRFLCGRRRIEKGPWIIQKGAPARSRRINAVALWTIHENHQFGVSPSSNRRQPRSTLVPNRGESYYPLSGAVMQEIAGAVGHLPPIMRMPLNARRQSKWPHFWGGFHITSGGSGPMRVKISLLTLQKVLTGEIPHDQFAKNYAEVLTAIRHEVAEGKMIGKILIEHIAHADDDWAELVFDRQMPSRLFADPGESVPAHTAANKIR